MSNLQLRYWTSKCIGDSVEIITMGRNSYIGDALKLLKNKNFTICDHELLYHQSHEITGGNIVIEEIFTTKEYKKWSNSLKNRKILFLEQCLETMGNKLMKWKNLCKENNPGGTLD